MKFSFRLCFSWRGEIAIRVCFKTCGHERMCTALVFKCPPPRYVGDGARGISTNKIQQGNCKEMIVIIYKEFYSVSNMPIFTAHLVLST